MRNVKTFYIVVFSSIVVKNIHSFALSANILARYRSNTIDSVVSTICGPIVKCDTLCIYVAYASIIQHDENNHFLNDDMCIYTFDLNDTFLLFTLQCSALV